MATAAEDRIRVKEARVAAVAQADAARAAKAETLRQANAAGRSTAAPKPSPYAAEISAAEQAKVDAAVKANTAPKGTATNPTRVERATVRGREVLGKGREVASKTTESIRNSRLGNAVGRTRAVGGGVIRAAINPVTIPLAGAQAVYSIGAKRQREEDQRLVAAQGEFGSAAPNFIQRENALSRIEPDLFSTETARRAKIGLDEIFRRAIGSDTLGLNAANPFTEADGNLREQSFVTDSQVIDRTTPLEPQGPEDRVAALTLRDQESGSQTRAGLDSFGLPSDQRATASGDLELIGRQMADVGIFDALADPLTPIEERSRLLRQVTEGLESQGAGGDAIFELLSQQGVDPDLLQNVSLRVGREAGETPLIGVDEAGNRGIFEDSTIRSQREVIDPLTGLPRIDKQDLGIEGVVQESTHRGASLGRPTFTGFNEDGSADFTDLPVGFGVDASQGFNIDETPENAARNAAARFTLRERVPQLGFQALEAAEEEATRFETSANSLRTFNRQNRGSGTTPRFQTFDTARSDQAQTEFAQSLRDPNLIQSLSRDIARKVPEMSAAQMSNLSAREKVTLRDKIRTEQQTAFDKGVNSARFNNELRRRADPGNVLRKRIRGGDTEAQKTLQRNEAIERATLRSEYEARLNPALPESLGFGVDDRAAGELSARRSVATASDQELRGDIGLITQDEESQNDIERIASEWGFKDINRSGRVTAQQRVGELKFIYAADKLDDMLRNVAGGGFTGESLGEAYQRGGWSSAAEILQSYFEVGPNGEPPALTFKDPDAAQAIFNGSARKAWVTQALHTLSGGRLGSKGIETMFLEGPSGEASAAPIGVDQILLETLSDRVKPGRR